MEAQITIEKFGKNGSSMTIKATCESIAELNEITTVCQRKGYIPRKKIFGIF